MKCNTVSVRAGISTYTSAISSPVPSVSLDLLKAIDDTVDALAYERDKINAFIITGQNLIDNVDGCSNDNPIDPGDVLSDALEKAEGALRERFAHHERCIESAKADGRLNGHHENTIIDEYSDTLNLISELYDVTCELRTKIMEYDADLSPVTGTFTDADSLITHLDNL